MTASGVRVAYSCEGDAGAPPMLLLHALGESRSSWDPVVQRFGERFRVYRFDLRGHGDSDWPGTYSLALMAADVGDAVAQLGLRDITVIGHSMGGMVAYRLAADDTVGVSRLVVEDAPPPYRRDRSVPDRPEEPLSFDWDAAVALILEVNEGDPDGWDSLADITAPTLLIGGGDASHIPQETLADVARRIPRCELRTIDVGHDVHESAPDRIVDAVIDWMA